ncbi:iron ABC transporter, partial [Butyricicoccus sp. 1XD8-22]
MSYTAWILLTASLVGISCGIVGVLLILRRMAMMADAISHTVLLGIVMAYLATQSLS